MEHLLDGPTEPLVRVGGDELDAGHAARPDLPGERELRVVRLGVDDGDSRHVHSCGTAEEAGPALDVRWIHTRYFFSLGTDNYVFGSPELYLPPMTWQHIVRHVPLKTDMNPYLDREYFEGRAATLRCRCAGSFHQPASRQ